MRICTSWNSLWLFFVVPVAGLWAQPALPVVEPSGLSVFDIDAGLPISCVFDGMIDPSGRLWVNPCYRQDEHRTINFFKFDGMQSAFVQWKETPAELVSQAVLSGFTPSGKLFGYFRESATCFIFDPDTQKARYFTLDVPGARISSCGITKAYGIIAHALSPTHHLVYRLDQKGVHKLMSLPRLDATSPSFTLGQPGLTLLTETDLWIANVGDEAAIEAGNMETGTGVLTRFEFKTRQTRNYTLETIFRQKPPPPISNTNYWTIASDRADTILIYLGAWETLFKLAPRSGTVQVSGILENTALNQRPSAKSSDYYLNITRDQSGSILYFRQLSTGFAGLLQDKNGRLYDYSPVLNAVQKKSRYAGSNIFTIHGRDFLQQVYVFTSGGLAAVDLKLIGTITTCLEGIPIRAITEASPGQYLTYPESAMPISLLQPRTDVSAESLKPLSIPCLKIEQRPAGPKHLVDIVKDAGGSFWVPYDNQLVRFRENGVCASFPVGKDFMRFAFADAATVVLAADDQIFSYSIPDKRLSALPVNGPPVKLNGVVNAIFVARDSTIWVAALDGLYQFKLKTGAYHRVGRKEGFQDERMMCINEGEDGRLWVGTYGGGLHIYDPRTGAVTVIDQKKGLSNNIVVGILADQSGVRWVSTYEGITLVSSKGEVLSRLYKEDGLSTNEFNRYSHYKSPSGDLLFGSISGINIFHPEVLKARILGRDAVRIFLTGFSYYDTAGDSLVNKTNWPYRVQTIALPATHRALGLRFALSSLVRVEENNFAYKLEGADIKGRSDWIYVGTNNELNLQNLPAGEYQILIRGCDHRGNWTTAPLAVPVRAAEIFYKQTWFIALCFCAALGLILAWVFRQKQERRRLEKELQARTNEIMRTRDQLVVQEKLASLGQLTAGIAHEIKNPLNFVNNFAHDSSGLADLVLSALQNNRSNIDPSRYQRLLRYLNDLKQIALDIKSKGRAADRIVRSMMDHARGTSEKMQWLDLNELIEETVHLVVSGFTARHPDFSVDLEEIYHPAGQRVYGSPLNLARAVLNILNNACYALQTKQQLRKGEFQPAIRIHTAVQGAQLALRIRDNGPGIDPEVMKDIFMPFFTTKPTDEGNTGLGLSICYDIIVTEHGGQIQVESEPGSFTDFLVTIPINGSHRN
ncbi:MAG: hypothetical protein H6574_08570 [Lewinellaceae bacterium]|nr:hypothetical protein [Saprospiraceae bacterium]MCB9331119.1 hypothetical protein [Lewinellaceae bacterium]